MAFRFSWVVLVAASASLPAACLAEDPGFRKNVAPILERRCVSCHNAKVAKGGLALDTRSAFLKGGEGGSLLEADTPDDTLLIEKITGPKPEMPKSGEPLTKTEVEALRAWVKTGADWPDGVTLVDRKFEGGTWWAFQPIVRPAIPAFSDPTWVRTPIDAFLLRKLDDAGMKPNARADRRTLIRRLSFDLIGLPPTPEEVTAFLNDKRPDAYEQLVNRLLDSPAYGERWARHWLDVAHYGDTHGYDKDKRRDHAWPYRDYVIDSFNRDVPYATFIKEQVAGDVLMPGNPRGVIAAGFLAAGPWDFVGQVELREGTVDKEKTRLLDRDDIVSSVITTVNSLTIGCARCHDHKFDPIPQRDYYRLQAVFSGIDRGDRPYDDGTSDSRRAELEAKRRDAASKLKKLDTEIDSLVKPKVAGLDSKLDVLRKKLAELPGTSRSMSTPSTSNGFHSSISPKADQTAWVQVDLGREYKLDEIRLIPARPVDFADTPGFGWPRSFRVQASNDPEFRADVQNLDHNKIDDADRFPDEPYVIRGSWASARYLRVTASRLWKRSNDYVLALAELEAISDGDNRALNAKVTASDSIEAGRWSTRYLVDGADSRFKRPPAGDASSVQRQEVLYQLQSIRTKRDELAGTLIGKERAERRTRLVADVAALDSQLANVPIGPMVYTVRPLEPRPIRVLSRGEVEKPGELVGPGTLSCLPGLPSEIPDSKEEGPRRAALAEWLVRPDNPLTWRSIVNRVWHYHMGKGLVDTPSDFGRNGSKPSHPELLDWLACEFRENGGSFKTLHRLIVNSTFYQQASTNIPAYAASDSDNRLFWRMNRRRLEAEALRDSVLFVAGTLDNRRGGPAFEPFRFKDDHSPIYDHTAIDRVIAPEMRRRSIYRFAVRSVPHPFLECLDAADPNLPTPSRSTTVTALQALALWNDPFMLAQAEALAARVASEPSLEARVRQAVRLAFARDPSAEETAALVALAKDQGMSSVCRLLFNANEFLFID